VNPSEDLYVHAPTLIVSHLRAAAAVMEAAAEQLPGETIYFPLKEDDEAQPIILQGDVALPRIGELIRYLADMLEA
jgi:hypothetical protein